MRLDGDLRGEAEDNEGSESGAERENDISTVRKRDRVSGELPRMGGVSLGLGTTEDVQWNGKYMLEGTPAAKTAFNDDGLAKGRVRGVWSGRVGVK
jgi:hypothetical protein